MGYQYGRRAPSNKPAIRFGDIITDAAVSIPAQEDYLSQFTGWKMLGNDRYGDCVAVATANSVALVTTALGERTVYPDQAAVFKFYRSQNPNFPSDDNGMNIQDALAYLVQTGIQVGLDNNGQPVMKKALGFAKVDVSSHQQIKAALAIFGFGILGVNVINVNQDEFGQGQPWDYDSRSALDGGHAIVGGGYDSDGVGGDIKFITWGSETSFTDAFWQHQVEEFWVVIFEEHLGSKQFLEGIDVATLASEYKTLTGRDFPVAVPTPPTPEPTPVPAPVPDPTPVPVPTPAPVPEPPSIDPDMLAFYNAVTKWAHARHVGSNKAAATAARAYFATQGLGD